MKAFQIQDGFGFDALKKVELAAPAPGPGEVLVRIAAAALNYRDLLVVRGQYDPKMRLPRIPLSDGVGEIVAVGEGVARWAVGDRVAGCFMQRWESGQLTPEKAKSALGGAVDGVLAEQVVFREGGIVRVPDHLSDEQAATLPCAAVTAWNALVEGGLKPGDTVLVLGTGGVSIFALQFAAGAGAKVIATSSSDEKLQRVKEMGAHETINYRTTPDWDRAVYDLTGSRGVDYIVEVGGAGTLPRSFRAVRLNGHISLIGVLAGAGEEVNPLPVTMKAVTMRGVYVGSREMFEAMNRFIEVHKLQPVVDKVFPVDEVVEALKYMESGAHFGKIVLRF